MSGGLIPKHGGYEKLLSCKKAEIVYDATVWFWNRPLLETRPPEIVASIIICLIHQTNSLLDRQPRQLEQAFLKEGGRRERMTRARLAARDKARR